MNETPLHIAGGNTHWNSHHGRQRDGLSTVEEQDYDEAKSLLLHVQFCPFKNWTKSKSGYHRGTSIVSRAKLPILAEIQNQSSGPSSDA